VAPGDRMTVVQETPLPGVGIRFEFRSSSGRRICVVHHRSGYREIAVEDEQDPDATRSVLVLDEEDSRTLAELLGASQVARELAELQQRVAGLAIDWLPIDAGSPYAGRTIGATRARTRTGVSIVAVLRGDRAIPAPGPEEQLLAGDTLVVVGTPRGIEDLSAILRTG
jgi:TrkA domain protein